MKSWQYDLPQPPFFTKRRDRCPIRLSVAYRELAQYRKLSTLPLDAGVADEKPFVSDTESINGAVEQEKRNGMGVTNNIGSGGVCLTLDWCPPLDTVFRLELPLPIPDFHAPTLAVVRWNCPLCLNGPTAAEFAVGLKFLL